MSTFSNLPNMNKINSFNTQSDTKHLLQCTLLNCFEGKIICPDPNYQKKKISSSNKQSTTKQYTPLNCFEGKIICPDPNYQRKKIRYPNARDTLANYRKKKNILNSRTSTNCP